MRGTDGAFDGFPEEAFAFLADLARHNNKTWFDANRDVYDAMVVGPALSFVEALGAGLRTIAPSVRPEPRIGGSLFRIHRDTRFSGDKSPYKTHVGIRFRDGDTMTSAKCTGPLFYVEFDATSLRLGVGVMEFDAPMLAAYRHAVANGRGAKVFVDMLAKAGTKGHDIVGETLARVPPAYAEHQGSELLKRRGFFILEESRLPPEIHQRDFVAYCRHWFKPYGPLFHELRRIAISAQEPQQSLSRR
jgi:uncharacterized protein (TIGR02453 family)